MIMFISSRMLCMIYGRDELSHPLGCMILCKLSIIFINKLILSFEGVFFCFNEHSKGLFICSMGDDGVNVLRMLM